MDECGKDYLDPQQRLTVYRSLADSTWFSHEYHLAESYLKKLLHCYKQLDKTDSNTVSVLGSIDRLTVSLFRLNRIGLLKVNIVNTYVY